MVTKWTAHTDAQDAANGTTAACNEGKSFSTDNKAVEGLQRLVEIDKEVVTALLKSSSASKLTLEDYEANLRTYAGRLDSRIYPIAVSFAATGASIGIIIPCMPLLIQLLHIPSSQFGLVVSAFGLSKLIGNIPAAYLVDRYGRKLAMNAGLGLVSVGIGGISAALLPGFGWPWLIACRFFTGLGVANFMAGSFMYVNDISTTLNRSRSMAPIMAGFQAGMALGPAIGGVLIDQVGIANTYATVGVLCGSLGL